MGNRSSVLIAVSASSAAVLASLLLRRKRACRQGLTPWENNFCALKRDELPADGRELFSKWVSEAEKKDGFSARVMAVATSTPDEGATVRSVIFHKMTEDGSIIFGTNATSQKSRALALDPRCELLFRWGDRQIRVRGKAQLAGNSSESDAAFARLPRHCQLGLQCLHQGAAIGEDEHAASINFYNHQSEKLGLNQAQWDSSVRRPATYTAVIVAPETFEFYQGGQPGYINDRFIFGRSSSSACSSGNFPLLTRLQA